MLWLVLLDRFWNEGHIQTQYCTIIQQYFVLLETVNIFGHRRLWVDLISCAVKFLLDIGVY